MMSEILKGLVGERCSILAAGEFSNLMGIVLAVDEEWIKLSTEEKKKESVIVKRIEDIKQISIISK